MTGNGTNGVESPRQVAGLIILLVMSACVLSCSDESPTAGTPTGRTLRVPGDYATIQLAVDAAQDGDNILMAPGTYTESVTIQAKAIALIGDTVNFGVALRPAARAYPALTLTDCATRATRLVGLVVEGAEDAAGIDGVRSSPTIHKNHIRDNSGATGGGIRLSQSGNALITANHIYRNHAINGGGIALIGAAADIIGNFLDTNWVYGDGAAIYCYGESAHVITGNYFRGNITQHRGGGIYFDDGGAVTVSGNLFFTDTARFGGGVHNQARDQLTIINNTFDHCIIRHKVNYTGSGAAIQWEHSLAVGGTIKNNIVANTWSNWDGAICAGAEGAGETVLDYNLLWNNKPDNYCVFTMGAHSQEADPKFCDWAGGNFHLRADSPCVGTGEQGGTIGAFGVGCETAARQARP